MQRFSLLGPLVLLVVATAPVAIGGCTPSQPVSPAAPSGPGTASEAPDPVAPGSDEPAPSGTQRERLTAEECEQQGGTVVGDIGDGATRRPDYRCPSGSAPLGEIVPLPGGPIAVEGSVCCPQ